MTALRLAIFDCDGTLVDSQANICMAMEHAFKKRACSRQHAMRRGASSASAL